MACIIKMSLGFLGMKRQFAKRMNLFSDILPVVESYLCSENVQYVTEHYVLDIVLELKRLSASDHSFLAHRPFHHNFNSPIPSQHSHNPYPFTHQQK